MKGQLRTLWLALLAGIVIVGCGSGGGGSTEPVKVNKTVTGIASKGPINFGKVTVYAVNENGTIGDSLGEALTTAEGTYSVGIGTYTGNVLVDVTGGTYIDEADPTGLPQPNPGLRAALANVSQSVSVAVTPLTEIAVKYAGAQQLTKTNIEDANSLVSAIVGIDIIKTMPANVISEAAATATEDEKTYGLMLASISQMVEDDNNLANISEGIDAIKNDLSDDNMLNSTGNDLLTALSTFCDPANGNNKTGVTALTDTPLDKTISDFIDKPVILPSQLSDLNKAKALVTDLRNTALSIYNYAGVGTPGIVETPFKNLAQELETVIAPELTATVDRLVWVIESAGFVEPGMTETFQHPDYGLLTLEISLSDNSKTGSFTVYDEDGISDSGTLTLDNPDRPTAGEFVATMKTESGKELKVVLDYSATTDNNGMYTGMTLTGSMTAPGLSLDFSQSGRKISVTFADNPDSDYLDDIYPTSIIFSGRITTWTAQMDGELDIPSILWASRANGYTDWQYTSNGWKQVEVWEGEFRPQKATFKGSFSELQNGAPTGVKFSGTITGKLNNAFTYDGCDMEDATNFLKWDASFDGSIEAPSRPTVTAFLKVAQSEYRKLALDVSYSRTNTDGSKGFLSGNGALEEKTETVQRCEYWGCYMDEDDYTVLQANLKNHDGMNVGIFQDGSKSKDKKFNGSITTSGGAEMADLYTINGVPTVKYIDYSIESIF